MLTLGLAQRGNGSLEEASADFDMALKLYQEQQQTLGEADTRYERAGIFLARGELDAAFDELSRAIGLVDQVMNSMSMPQRRSLFLRQYAELYTQSAITMVRLNRDTAALDQLQAVAQIVGGATIVRHITAYEETIPASGDDMGEDEIRVNKDLVKRLEQLRKKLR
jgi:tetratricopeptide (TPR) repeat protein